MSDDKTAVSSFVTVKPVSSMGEALELAIDATITAREFAARSSRHNWIGDEIEKAISTLWHLRYSGGTL